MGVEKVVYIIVANFAPENVVFGKKAIKVGNDELPYLVFKFYSQNKKSRY